MTRGIKEREGWVARGVNWERENPDIRRIGAEWKST